MSNPRDTLNKSIAITNSNPYLHLEITPEIVEMSSHYSKNIKINDRCIFTKDSEFMNSECLIVIDCDDISNADINFRLVVGNAKTGSYIAHSSISYEDNKKKINKEFTVRLSKDSFITTSGFNYEVLKMTILKLTYLHLMDDSAETERESLYNRIPLTYHIIFNNFISPMIENDKEITKELAKDAPKEVLPEQINITYFPLEIKNGFCILPKGNQLTGNCIGRISDIVPINYELPFKASFIKKKEGESAESEEECLFALTTHSCEPINIIIDSNELFTVKGYNIKTLILTLSTRNV